MTTSHSLLDHGNEPEALLKKKRGRPKCFDENQALEKAMYLFWEHGYEATTVQDLTLALGITAPSLYCSFGDKETLFSKSIDYYLCHEACPLDTILAQAKTAYIAFEIYLYNHVKRLTQPNKPKGCMLVTALLNCSEQTQVIQNDLSNKRRLIKQKLLQRVEQGIADGDVDSAVYLVPMINFYYTIIQGLSIQARDGVPIDELKSVVAYALEAWNLFKP